MIHYIYKITFLCGRPEGRYYIGKRSTSQYDNWKEDPYAGSGAFCDNYYEEYGKLLGITYRKECLEENDSYEENRIREKYWIGDLYKLDPLCMNRMAGGAGVKTVEEIKGVKVCQYDFEGNLVNVYRSQLDAAEKSGCGNSSISVCCSHKQPRAGRYIWRLEGDCVTQEDLRAAWNSYGLVDQYDKHGNYIRTWDSIKEAAEVTGCNEQSIGSCITQRNKNRHLCGGFGWTRHNEPFVNNKIVNNEGPVAVDQYTLDLKFVKTYPSYADAAKAVGGVFQSIQSACNEKCESAYGYLWVKHGGEPKTKTNNYIGKRKVAQYDKRGNCIAVYDTLKEASDAIGTAHQNIQACCCGKCKTAKGYVWKYVK